MRRFSALAANKTYWATGGRDLRSSAEKEIPHFKPGPDRSEKSNEFKRWMNLFFIKQGGYDITKKGYGMFGKPEGDIKLTIEERTVLAKEKVTGLITEGKAEELYDQGMVRRVGYVDWGNDQNRIPVVRKFVEMIGNPSVISKLHFHEYGLSKLLMHYKGSVRKALEEAGVEGKTN